MVTAGGSKAVRTSQIQEAAAALCLAASVPTKTTTGPSAEGGNQRPSWIRASPAKRLSVNGA